MDSVPTCVGLKLCGVSRQPGERAALEDLVPGSRVRLADRYELVASLGRGGMGAVYRAHDVVSGRDVALKRLTTTGDAPPSMIAIERLEREYNVLDQLTHPRIIRVLDYGLDGTVPFYTMELLDGGDLGSQSPMAWQDACRMAFDICSALSLLHSRKLVHRDVTPYNIHLSVSGEAKLIDFGLLSSMGPQARVAGTPAYVAPELVSNMSLDGRSDLFSLGCSLYHALTGVVAYNASAVHRLRDVWRGKPPRVSKLVPGIPDALDKLVFSMLRVDVDSRPRSAGEVMDRLRPWLREAPDESLEVAHAYLSAPSLVARATPQRRMRERLIQAACGHGGGFLIESPEGTGRSRMLDVFAMEAKLLGNIVVRASASDAVAGPFGVVLMCEEQADQAWLFLLTGDELELSASTTTPDDPDTLLAYAAAHLEDELVRHAELTSDELSQTLGEEAFFVDPPESGTERWAIPLRASRQGVQYVVGVVVLSGIRQQSPYAMVVATRLAEQLLASGSCQPRCVV